MSLRTDILMVTYAKDAAFAEYALRSVRRFCTGFGGVTVVVPHDDVALFRGMEMPHGTVVRGFNEPEGKGMVAHEAVVCEADIWCPNADVILHLDADTLFWADATPDDFMHEGRPIIYREKFEDFRESHPTRYGWKAAVNRATGIDPVWETMVRHPAVHLAPTYGLTRHIIAEHTGMDWKEYVLSCENDYPQGFAEFPTLGAVALECARNRYHWIDQEGGGKDYVYEQGRDKVFNFWSHCGVDGTCDRHPGRTAREVMEEILK